MPIYEYHCERCDRKFEVIEKFSAEPLKVHEGCGGAVERLVSVAALQFKGSGFYITDYTKNGAAPEAKSEKSDKPESKSDSKKSDSKTDSKSDSKTDSKNDSKSDSKPAAAKTESTAATSKSESTASSSSAKSDTK